MHRFRLSSRIAQVLTRGLQSRELLNKELDLIERYNITVLDFLSDEYPACLREIHHPPLVLYCAGSPMQIEKAIAIVGARKADAYGRKCVDQLVPPLVQTNWTIVSGGASGIDAMAHKKTVESGGKTIAVFGTGLMHPYPEKNKELFRTIARSGGTLVSPFSMQTKPHKGNFPARNRVIAGLSQGCIVVQAAQRSGALITAEFSLNQGKSVFALPGPITNELSEGCHKLIQQGAKLVQSADDVFEEFGELSICVKKPSEATHISDPILMHLEQPMSLDELYSKTGIEISELQHKLFTMQLEGKVRQTLSGLWEAR